MGGVSWALRTEGRGPALDQGGRAVGKAAGDPLGGGAGEPDDGVARPNNVTETLVASAIVPDGFRAPTLTSWSADRAVTELYAVHYRGLVRLASFLCGICPPPRKLSKTRSWPWPEGGSGYATRRRHSPICGSRW